MAEKKASRNWQTVPARFWSNKKIEMRRPRVCTRRALVALASAASANAGGDASQSCAEQKHRRRFRDSGLLRACDLTCYRDGLAGVNRNVVDTEGERAVTASSLPRARRLRLGVGFAVRVAEGE